MLVPGTGGVFDLDIDGERVWSKQAIAGARYPEPAALVPLVEARLGPAVL